MTFPDSGVLAIFSCAVLVFTIVAGLIAIRRKEQKERNERV